jgi:hypothetical protein
MCTRSSSHSHSHAHSFSLSLGKCLPFCQNWAKIAEF